MASTTTDRKTAIINLAEEIRKSKAEAKGSDASNDVKELESLIEQLKKKRGENTVASKVMKNVTQKIDKASNPTTYLRAVIPKMFKTFHENLDTYDKERTAQMKLDKIQDKLRQEQVDKLRSSINDLIQKDKSLSETLQRFGKAAATQAALALEESKATRQAEEEYINNMAKIDDRLKNIGKDAEAEWAKRKGIQLVKIVKDEATKEELEDIKLELSKQLEQDAEQFNKQRLEAIKKANEERRYKADMLKEQSWFRRHFGKNKGDGEKQNHNFLSNLLGAWAIESILPLLIKGGLIAGFIAALKKYAEDPEFKAKVDELLDWLGTQVKEYWSKVEPMMTQLVESILKGIGEFMIKHWEYVLAALALAFPLTTLRLIGAALTALYTAIVWAAKKIGTIGGAPPIDLPDSPDKKGDKGKPSGKPGSKKLPPRDPKTGRFMKRAPVSGGLKGFKGIGGPLAMVAGALFLDGLFAHDEMAAATYGILEDSPFFEQVTDDEMEKFIDMIENKKYDDANKYHQDLARKYGFEANKKGWGLYGFDYKKIEPPRPAPNVAPRSNLNLQDPNAMLFNDMMLSRGLNPSGGGGLNLNAPQVNTSNVSNTTVIPWKTAVDPKRSIMFENRP